MSYHSTLKRSVLYRHLTQEQGTPLRYKPLVTTSNQDEAFLFFKSLATGYGLSLTNVQTIPARAFRNFLTAWKTSMAPSERSLAKVAMMAQNSPVRLTPSLRAYRDENIINTYVRGHRKTRDPHCRTTFIEHYTVHVKEGCFRSDIGSR